VGLKGGGIKYVGLAMAKQEDKQSSSSFFLQLFCQQVQPIISSYSVATLLDEYVEGTRQWMFDHVNAWLHTALGSTHSGSPAGASAAASASASEAAPAGPDIPPNSRLLLLLAGPGMGKSVMSAAMEAKLMVRTHKNHRLVQVGHLSYTFIRHWRQHVDGLAHWHFYRMGWTEVKEDSNMGQGI